MLDLKTVAVQFFSFFHTLNQDVLLNNPLAKGTTNETTNIA